MPELLSQGVGKIDISEIFWPSGSKRLLKLFMPPVPPSVTGEVYCFPRRQLIFSFGRRVIYHLKGL